MQEMRLSVGTRTQSVEPFENGLQAREQLYWPRRQMHLSIVVNDVVKVSLHSVRAMEHLVGLARAYFVEVVHAVRCKYPLNVARFVER